MGEDTQEDFDEFMRKHGDQFPEQPQNLDELLDTLAERSAAAQRMLNSMTPEQRDELVRAYRALRAAGGRPVDGPADPGAGEEAPGGRC